MNNDGRLQSVRGPQRKLQPTEAHECLLTTGTAVPLMSTEGSLDRCLIHRLGENVRVCFHQTTAAPPLKTAACFKKLRVASHFCLHLLLLVYNTDPNLAPRGALRATRKENKGQREPRT